ncbi:butyrophilin subfamily 1 member A1 isoform X1 [Carassius gibelio]|uniref:butyrophilin subfamily 1 member A1 isoform X1 n=1 Tax=Carassius gibelio TaxID=101364 RepID=UPI0022776D78|nr:butyrophilin subfamily 1 member A1 isoform X1 [Carassius gibelio]XP_052427737.1 butyrophilin subfamily 1 member A1 isoform X1 [Carassius gibelio]XP_052427738.1 butyrophilin subfamily 1 member A1 isoform X1 [Carassius gibelio]
MLWLLLCIVDVLVASFEVTIPNKHLLAIQGRPAVLGCEFTPDPDLSSLVVTWQRLEDARVVHSYYYQQDQLDRQSPEYHTRTSLYVSELHKGNGSLRIAAVRPKDAGQYMCIVSNTKGTGKDLMEVTYEASFEVTIPNKHLVAIRGRSAVLGCEFTPDPDLSNLVITWQRQEDARVVHSYYYQQDQLDRQSPEYHTRTSLYVSELHKGNGSLRIAAVRPKDAGWYLCTVSNTKGTGRALMEVTYGALYSEPRLSIHVNSSALKVQFETEGFPKPEVIWLGEHDQNLSYNLEIHGQTEDGLYFIKTICEAQKPVINISFTLKNPLLNQNLQRPVVLSYDEDTTDHMVIVLAVLSMVCILLVIGIIWLAVQKQNKQRSTL